jgi:adenine-specific DNA-methyltransferase
MLISQKAENAGKTQTCLLDKSLGSLEKMSDFIRQSVITQGGFKPDSGWVILSPLEAAIKNKIEAIGTPLKDWDINIYRGILTGFNDAFIIDQKTRDALIEASPKNGEIIRPILRGRDIKKYNAHFANQWIINTHNGIREKKIPPVDVKKDYPAVYDHLSKYEDALSKRLDKGQHWSNLRNCAYLGNFESEKIVWIELTDQPNFALDKSAFYLNNTIFFMIGNHLKYLLAFLNSRLCEWYFDKIAATSGAGTRRWIKMYIDQICVPFPDKEIESKIIGIVDSLNESFDMKLYKSLDNEIYDIFKLSSEEIDLLINASL